jgi:Icc-related predicted phosphoesterase
MNAIHITDIHLEWWKNLVDFSSVIDKKVADIVILTGDIAGGTYAVKFIEHLIGLGYQVIYVLGNHEFYGHDVDELIVEWRELSKEIKGLHFLEGDSVVIGDVEFFGTCLWTSLDTSSKSEDVSFFLKLIIKKESDFIHTKNWNVNKMKDRFHDAWGNLQNIIEASNSKKKVVLSHYLPSYACIHECYVNSTNNPMFATELGNYIAQSEIMYWFHGHTHSSVDKIIGSTRIICEPYGYHDINMINPEFTWIDKIYEF